MGGTVMDNRGLTQGIPEEYNKSLFVSRRFNVNPGQLNKWKMRPSIINEHSESSNEAYDEIDAATDIMQVFKSSQDNMNGVFCTLESAAAETTIDDIEYSGVDATLQAAWILTGTNLAVTEAVIISPNQSSAESMKLNMNILNDLWTFKKSSGSWDMTEATIEFDLYVTDISTEAQLSVLLNDTGAGTSTVPLAVSDPGVWRHFSVPVGSLSGTVDITIVDEIAFKVTNRKASQFAYVDNVRFRPFPGSFDLELWDMGSTIPLSDGTVDYTSAGTQYTELGDRGIGGAVASSVRVQLKGGKQKYHIPEMIAGVALEIAANTVLNVGNFYALVFKYVDTNITVYGPDTTEAVKRYNALSGYGAKAEVADNFIDILPGANGAGAYSDLSFIVASTQKVYAKRVTVRLFDSSDALTNSSVDTEIFIYVEDNLMKITDGFIDNEHFIESIHDITISDARKMVKGSKFEVYYSAGIDDAARTAIVDVEYAYIKEVDNV